VVAAAPADVASASGTPVLHAPWLQKAGPDPELRESDARERRQGRESREVGDGVHDLEGASPAREAHRP
jgi:hypothetical protein